MSFSNKYPTPVGEDPSEYMLNIVWDRIAAEANKRIKVAVSLTCTQDSDGDRNTE